jgi:phosphate acetyltransferase
MDETTNRAPAISHDTYDRLIAAAQKEARIKVAVAHPCDDVSLRGAVEAKRLELIEPVLVGPVERIRGVASQAGLDIDAMEIVPSEHSHDSAAKAVGLVTAGKVEALMKGSLHTDELMGAVVSRESGIRTARRISHCFIMDVPNHPTRSSSPTRRSTSPLISTPRSISFRTRSIWRMRLARPSLALRS